MDKISTIHIVSEIAVLSVMFVYFDRRLKTLESNMEYMKKNYMHAFEDIYKKLELLKQGILTTQSMSQMNNMNNNQNSSTLPKQTKIGKLERIETVEKSENNNKKTETIEVKEINMPQIQKRAFTTLISEISELSTLSTPSNNTAQVEIIDEDSNNPLMSETNKSKDEEITENDMNEIEKLIEGKSD